MHSLPENVASILKYILRDDDKYRSKYIAVGCKVWQNKYCAAWKNNNLVFLIEMCGCFGNCVGVLVIAWVFWQLRGCFGNCVGVFAIAWVFLVIVWVFW